jgi:hypothetical protein
LQYGKFDPVVRNAWQYYNSFSYGINSYFRPATLLRTLENYLGPPTMARIMRTWFERYRFRHPTTVDFQKVVNEISGRNMDWFFDQFVFGTNWLNYKVESVSNDEIGSKPGSYVENGKRFTISEDEARKNKKKPVEYRVVVKLKREGEAIFPVDVKLTYRDGRVETRQWDGRDRWVKYDFTSKAKLARVEIDPDHKILLDGSIADNSWVEDSDFTPFARWSSNLLYWLQMVLP